jgi:hypothetical protein
VVEPASDGIMRRERRSRTLARPARPESTRGASLPFIESRAASLRDVSRFGLGSSFKEASAHKCGFQKFWHHPFREILALLSGSVPARN